MKTFYNSTFIVGQNAQENWSMLSNASQKDLFFHLTSFSSAYGILKYPYDTTIIPDCASILKLNSNKAKNLHRVKVDYTPVSNTRKGDVLGEVIYKNKKYVQTILV